MSLRNQAVSLTIMHAANVIQPIVVLPFAAWAFGPLHVGKYAYALAIGQLAATIVNYGFHWTAQREVASVRHEPSEIAFVVAKVAVTKSLLLVAVSMIALMLAGSVLAMSKLMLLCVMLPALGGIIFPMYLFLGLERAWQAAIAMVVARVLALIWFVSLVKTAEQLELAVAIQGGIPVIGGIICLPFMYSIGLRGFRFVKLSTVGTQLREGWRGFLFVSVEQALVILPVLLVGHFTGYVAAGQYSIADKFLNATRVFFKLLTEILLPRVAYYAHAAPVAGIQLIRRSMLSLVGGAAISLGMFFVAPHVIAFFFGDELSGAIPIVRSMAILPLLMNINVLTSNLFMFTYGYEQAWGILNALALLVFLVLSVLLSLWMSAEAVVYALVAKEVLVLVVSAAFFLVAGAAVLRKGAAHDGRGLPGRPANHFSSAPSPALLVTNPARTES
jgi:PST family polysaccharide transporter